jgi:hypothetical protein
VNRPRVDHVETAVADHWWAGNAALSYVVGPLLLAAGGVERADPSRQSTDVLRDGFAVSSRGKYSISQQLVKALL